jgi:hypothetical protein
MRILMGVVLAAGLAAQRPPDLSGVWQLNKARSTVEIQMAWAQIKMTSSVFSVYLRTFDEKGTEEGSDWRFTIGAGESSNAMHGAPMKSHAVWEGTTLVVQSATLFGSETLKTVDRWTLSEDGKTLTLVEKHRFGNEPEGTSVFVFERRTASAWPPPDSHKPAEEVYKNIQILKGISAERLPVVMGNFARALSVNCTYCHADGDFASDSKPMKQTARRMYEMVNTTNRDSFGGATALVGRATEAP